MDAAVVARYLLLIRRMARSTGSSEAEGLQERLTAALVENVEAFDARFRHYGSRTVEVAFQSRENIRSEESGRDSRKVEALCAEWARSLTVGLELASPSDTIRTSLRELQVRIGQSCGEGEASCVALFKRSRGLCRATFVGKRNGSLRDSLERSRMARGAWLGTREWRRSFLRRIPPGLALQSGCFCEKRSTTTDMGVGGRGEWRCRSGGELHPRHL